MHMKELHGNFDGELYDAICVIERGIFFIHYSLRNLEGSYKIDINVAMLANSTLCNSVVLDGQKLNEFVVSVDRFSYNRCWSSLFSNL